MSDVSVAYEALSSDAKVWEGVSEELSRMLRALDFVEIPRSGFSFGALEAGDRYQEALAQVRDLVREGIGATAAISVALDEVRRKWEGHEETVASDVKGMWSPDV